ncbi:hypothetical protein D3C71_460570 [compost metagenome]
MLQEGQGLTLQVRAGLYAQAVHLLRRHRPDAMETLHRQGLDKGLPSPWRDHELAVRLALVRGQLGQELVVGHPGRRRQIGLLENARADLLGRRRGRRQSPDIGRDVKIGLIERQGFDQGRVVCENGVDLRRDGPIDLEPGRREDQFRTLPQGRARGHGRAHAELARLIAGGGDHAARSGVAYSHRPSTQGRIIPLLHRGEEGVHVHMDDLARRGDVHAPRLAEREQSRNRYPARQHRSTPRDQGARPDKGPKRVPPRLPGPTAGQ